MRRERGLLLLVVLAVIAAAFLCLRLGDAGVSLWTRGASRPATRGITPTILPRITPPAALKEALAGLLVNEESEQEELPRLQRLLATFPADRPRACVFILAFPVHCGDDLCKRGTGVVQLVPLVQNLRILSQQLLHLYGYPLVIYHEDYDSADKQQVQEAVGDQVPVFFQRIQMTQAAVPAYCDRQDVWSTLYSLHTDWRLDQPVRGVHGFGYRTMCRLFAGLLPWTPLMLEFDYYMRIDGGDSRVRAVATDPFRLMRTNGYRYLYNAHGNGLANVEVVDAFADALDPFFRERNLQPDRRLLRPLIDRKGRFNGNYYYNNLEVTELSILRQPIYWDFFLTMDRLCAFYMPRKNGLGDGEFRSVALALVAKAPEVRRLDESIITYEHPVGWADP